MTPPALALHEPDVALLRDLLASATRILVTTHKHPDGDAIGSLLATAHALRAVGKTVTAHAPDAPPEALRFLAESQTVTEEPGPLTEYDLVFALDHSELGRTGLASELLNGRVPVVAIDHHATADRRGCINIVVTDAAATCELLAALFPLLGLPIDAATATCLLTGLVTDTGSFQHANTSARVLATAGRLLALGADLRGVVRSAFGPRSLPALRVMGRALERLRASPETGAAISVVTHQDLQECGASEHDLSGLVNLLNTIPEASFSLLLTEVERGTVRGSLRSEPEKAVDVASIARRFGGGGHTLASGFEVAGRLVRDTDGWRIA